MIAEFKYVLSLLNGCRLTSRRVVMQSYRGLKALCQLVWNKVSLYSLPDLYFIGGTPTGRALDSVLNEHFDRIDRVISNPAEYAKIPPLDIYVLTDGVPSASISLMTKLASQSSFHRVADDPASVIAKAVTRLKKCKYHPNTMGIQFVQIGDESDAKKALKMLVEGDNGVRYGDRYVSSAI
jgi:uncharacterized protein YegL